VRRRVLVLTRDMIPIPGHPVSGGGIRVWGLGEALRARGHDVVYSVPSGIVPRGEEHDALRQLSFEPGDLQRTLLRAEPDVVLVEQWGLATYLDEVGLPVVLDLHGSLILENAFRRHRTLASNAAAKIKALHKVDFVICPAVRQRAYFMAWMMMSGADPTSIPIEVVPVSMSPDLPQPGEKDDEQPLALVYGGQLWPWIDPEPALLAAAGALDRAEAGTLHLFVQEPEHTDVLPFDGSTEIPSRPMNDALKNHPRVRFEGMVSHDELLQRYAAADLAVDLYAWNSERELAYTTRTVEYLWCGLPVIYGDYGELAQLIQEYEAGWTVRPDDAGAVESVVQSVLQDRKELRRRSDNARRLVRERLTWDTTVGPLDAFVNDPVIRTKGSTIFGKLALEFDRIGTETRTALDNTEASISELQREIAARDRRITELLDELARRDRSYTEMVDRHGSDAAAWDGERRQRERVLEEIRGDAQRVHHEAQMVKELLRCEQDDHAQTSVGLETARSELVQANRRLEQQESQIKQLRTEIKGAVERIGAQDQSSQERIEGLERQLREVSERELALRGDLGAAVAQADELRGDLERSGKREQALGLQLQQAQQMMGRFKEHWLQRTMATGQHSFRRVTTQVPALAGLFVRNLANNAYMTIWQKRHNVRIFPGQ